MLILIGAIFIVPTIEIILVKEDLLVIGNEDIKVFVDLQLQFTISRIKTFSFS